MRSILRDPGAEVMVGLLGFFASFLGIGLAITALADKSPSLLCYSYIAFGIAFLLFVVAIIASIFLVRHLNKIRGYIRQIGLYLRRGYILRKKVLDVQGSWPPEMGEEVTQWEDKVQQWLDNNLPDHAPDFPLETLTSTTSYYYYDHIPKEASTAALKLESRLSNLREILRDVRR